MTEKDVKNVYAQFIRDMPYKLHVQDAHTISVKQSPVLKLQSVLQEVPTENRMTHHVKAESAVYDVFKMAVSRVWFPVMQ